MNRPAIHSGEHIAEELEALDMFTSTLARNLSIPSNRITEICVDGGGSRPIPHPGSASGPGYCQRSV